MVKYKISAIFLVALSLGVFYFLYVSETDPQSRFGFQYGLDLKGGSHLVYEADVSVLSGEDVGPSLEALRNVIERRVNSQELSGVFGVLDPLVQVERGGVSGGDSARIIVELPGVTDIEEAVAFIGETPLLEFMLEDESSSLDSQVETLVFDENGELLSQGENDQEAEENIYDSLVSTGITGRFLTGATVQFDEFNRPFISLSFNREGRELFAKVTADNVGKPLAIVLDRVPISMPVIQQEIKDGNPIITGSFTVREAREIVRDLNFGALPVPIELVSTQSIGASLGERVLDAGVYAATVGLLVVATFLILWYRLPGLLAVLALITYIGVMLALFKLIPVTLTAAGIAGFILSIGMAVDANVLIFERMKEGLRQGKDLSSAIFEGFRRAWPSIRDGNISSVITAVILFWFGTSLVKGFALTFGIGVLVSMVSAIFVTRTFLLAVSDDKGGKFIKFLYGSGFRS